MTVGAAVVGLGVGEAHARAYAALDDASLLLVHDLDRDRAGEVAARLGCRAAESFEQILADDDVSVVSIASFDDAHFGQVVAALAAGKHVFAEKPLCRTADEARQVELAWRDSGRNVASNLVLRSAPAYGWLREQIAAGALGEIYAFDGDYLYGRLHKITEGWRRSVDDYSVMLGGGIHLVDLMLWLTAQRPGDVVAAGNRISTSGTAFRYDDFVAARFRFSSGLVGRITANFGSVHPHQHVVRVFGTAATALCDDAGVRVYRSRDPETAPERVDLPSLPASKAELLARFVRHAREGLPWDETPHELAVIRACVAADQALVRGECVDIDSV